MVDNNITKHVSTISIKTIEKNVSKTYTDTESTIKTLENISRLTHRSFNEVLKEIVNNFIENGKIYDPDGDAYYGVHDLINKNNNIRKDID